MHWYIFFLCGIFWQGRSVYPKVWMLITSKLFENYPRAPVNSFSQFGRKKPPAINPWSLVCIGVSTPSSKTPPTSFLTNPRPPSPPIKSATIQASLPRKSLPLYWFFLNPRPQSWIFQWTSKILKFFILITILSLKSN